MPDAAPDSPFLELDAHLTTGSLDISVRFTLSAPWSALFGPSGSGKSTVLRAIAGLHLPASGTLRIRQETLTDTVAGYSTPIHRRPVRMAPQQPFLFPSRSVRANLLFGAPGAHALLAEVAPLLELDALLDRRPHDLSGGEQQRVNLGRATLAAAAAHAILLLDEPFTGMDAARRDRLAPRLQHWLHARQIPVLSVTHDLGEIFLLQPEVLRLADGRIAAQGPPALVLQEERSRLLRNLGA